MNLLTSHRIHARASEETSDRPINLYRFESAVSYKADPLVLYHGLTQGNKNTLLYESADLDHQHALKSFMIIDASLRIAGLRDEVTVTALTLNGEGMLKILAESALKPYLIEKNRKALRFKFKEEHPHSPIDILRTIQALADPALDNDYSLFLGGLLGYDLVGFYHGITIPEKNRTHDMVVYLAESMVAIDHVTKTATLQINQYGDDAELEMQLRDRFVELKEAIAERYTLPEAPKKVAKSEVIESDETHFLENVTALKERIKSGEFAQIVPSRTFKIACDSPLHAYARLKASHPSPYLFYLNDADFVLFGASPERALKFDRISRELELYPIAGTKPRGRIDGEIDPTLDERIEEELKNDPKEVSEHMMLVELAKEDLAPISEADSIIVRDLMKIDRYAYVMHLVSRVQSRLQPGLDAFDAYIATMNMGTLTGSPKGHAMETIYQIEDEARGSYGGGIGYLTSFGDLDSCIVIRSAMVKEGIAKVQAGAGIVADSVPQTELEETRNKASAVVRAIVGE